jgi:hypothetical protein
MILCNSNNRSQRIVDWVQTLLNIEDEKDLEMLNVLPKKYGFYIDYRYREYGDWYRDSMKLYNSQILLLESFR